MADTITTNNIRQYKLLFVLSWTCFYLIYPAWALPVSTGERAAVFFGFIAYFLVSSFFMCRWFDAVPVKAPLFPVNIDWKKRLKDNIGLVAVCSIAVIMQISPLSLPILMFGDEPIHLQGGLFAYDYIDVGWHKVFQGAIWAAAGIVLLYAALRKKWGASLSGLLDGRFLKGFSVLLFFGVLVSWFFLLKDIEYQSAFIRYPPVSRVLYFLTYSAFGISRIVPRAVQMVFYILSAVYLYRTLNLYYEKETSLFGAVLYLFLPVTFAYAHLAEMASGTAFFIIACSFYFVRFIKEDNSRDLIIATYLIGTGCLYKKLNLLLFIICAAFFILYKLRNRDQAFLPGLKVLLIAMVPIFPWVMLTRSYSWRNFVFQSSNFTSLQGKVFTYFPLIASNLSEVVSLLAVLSVLYIALRKRNALTAYFGLLFSVYYFFIVADIGYLSPRFSLAFYPTIIIFLSIFLSRIVQAFKWKHAFKVFFALFSIYLIAVSAVYPLNDRYLNITNKKLTYFPSEEAMMWVRDNVGDGERIMTLRIMSYNFYRVKYGIEKEKLIGYWYNIMDISSPEHLKEIYKKEGASYIMFPYSPDYPLINPVLSYLNDNEGNEFLEVEKFSMGENNIFVYKLNEG